MKSKIISYLTMAAKIARSKNDQRHFFLGGVGVRADDVTVYSYNGAPKFPNRKHHCEARLARKLDEGATVYIARTNAKLEWANSKPCHSCEIALKRAKVKRVYYTIAPNEYGCLIF